MTTTKATGAEQPRWTCRHENGPLLGEYYALSDGTTTYVVARESPLYDLIPRICALLNAEGAVRELTATANEAIRRASWFTCGHSWPDAFMSEALAAERSFDAYRMALTALAAAMPPEEEKR